MPSVRSALGFVAIVLFLAAYIGLAVTLGDYVPDHWAADVAYYLIAGIAWVPAAGRLLRWGAGPAA